MGTCSSLCQAYLETFKMCLWSLLARQMWRHAGTCGRSIWWPTKRCIQTHHHSSTSSAERYLPLQDLLLMQTLTSMPCQSLIVLYIVSISQNGISQSPVVLQSSKRSFCIEVLQDLFQACWRSCIDNVHHLGMQDDMYDIAGEINPRGRRNYMSRDDMGGLENDDSEEEEQTPLRGPPARGSSKRDLAAASNGPRPDPQVGTSWTWHLPPPPTTPPPPQKKPPMPLSSQGQYFGWS